MVQRRNKKAWRRPVTRVPDHIAHAPALATRPLTVVVDGRAHPTLARPTPEQLAPLQAPRPAPAVRAARGHHPLLAVALARRLTPFF